MKWAPKCCLYIVLIILLTSCRMESTHDSAGNNTRISKISAAKDRAPLSMTKHKKEYRNIYLQEKDGPPKGYIPAAYTQPTPEIEPLSRYGNPDIYQVNGKQYEVMTSAKGYHASGIASWYGTKFHRHRTSSGERYDLYALTAAHKTLPLPTYVQVKNLKNGREIIVKVNDRGPFHDDRIIDLSYGAAAQLGFLAEGTAPVEINAVSIGDEKTKEAGYYLQAGAFSSEKHARGLLEKIKKLSTSPVMIEKYNDFFVVKVGPLASKQVSNQLKQTLKSHGIQGAFSLLQ